MIRTGRERPALLDGQRSAYAAARESIVDVEAVRSLPIEHSQARILVPTPTANPVVG